MIDLAPQNPYGLSLCSPVLTAAGCFGMGTEYARHVPIERLGAIVTHSVSLHGRRGKSWLIETPAGLLSGSWPQLALAYVLRHYAPTWATWATPVILSVAAEYAEVATMLDGVEGVAGLELAITDPAQAAAVTAAVRAATVLPLMIKLASHDALVATAQAVADAGADALTLIAPPAGSVLDARTGQLQRGVLCGPAIQPVALAAVNDVCAVVRIPVVACGGIVTEADARAFLAVGAVAIQLGSALLANPFAATTVAEALAAS